MASSNGSDNLLDYELDMLGEPSTPDVPQAENVDKVSDMTRAELSHTIAELVAAALVKMAPSKAVPDQAGQVTAKEAAVCGEKAVKSPTKRMLTPEAVVVLSPASNTTKQMLTPEAVVVSSPAGVTTATTGSACSGCGNCRVTRSVSRLSGDMIEEFYLIRKTATATSIDG